MLTALRLGNFKAFSQTQRLPIRPITLIFGANSAGKSSLIHGLLLARHALDKNGDLDPHRTSIGGDAVDLGGFRQYVFAHDEDRSVDWAAEMDTTSFTGREAELLSAVRTLTVGAQIKLLGASDVNIEKLSAGDALRALKGVKWEPRVARFSIEADGNSLLSMSARHGGILQLDRLDVDHRVIGEMLRAIVLSFTTTESVSPSDYETLKTALNEIVPSITARVERFIPEKVLEASDDIRPSLVAVSSGNRDSDLAQALKLFLPRRLSSLFEAVSRTLSEDLSRMSYLGPLRSYPPRHLAFAEYDRSGDTSGGANAWNIVRLDSRVRAMVNRWLGSADRLQTPYELTVRDLVPDSTLEQELPELMGKAFHDALVNLALRYYHGIEDGVDPSDRPVERLLSKELGESLANYHDYPNPDIQSIASALIDNEELAQEWKDEILDAATDKTQDLVLVDKRTDTPVSHRDVGIGISQVLPVLVNAYASERRIVAMEQPELHLHPKLQAELGDVLIESALGERRNTFIIETHSEHLILRILRRIRQTPAGKNDATPAIKPEHVALLFVGGGDSGSTVQELRVDNKGRIVDRIPGGFFEEAFEELF